MRRLACVVTGLLMLGLCRAAQAEVSEVRLLRQVDVGNLPLLVAEHEKLIEKQAEKRGLGTIGVHWLAPDKAGAAEALTGAQADLAAIDLAAFIALWDAKADTDQAVRGLADLAQMPYVLVARNPKIGTIRDFAGKDRIAVSGLHTTMPALMLEMAAAQEWGAEHYDKLDPLTLARPDADFVTALLSEKGEIDAHVSRMPYDDMELGSREVHRVMDSYEVGGPHSSLLLAATARFHDANPGLCGAILAALEEADKLIKASPGKAAEIYMEVSHDKDLEVEDVSDMIGDPDLAYVTAPAGVTRIAAFMHKIGRLKHEPSSWRDLFFAEAHNLNGS